MSIAWVDFYYPSCVWTVCGFRISAARYPVLQTSKYEVKVKCYNLIYLLFHADGAIFSPLTMEHVLSFEKSCNEFFLTVKDYVRKRNDAIGVEFSDVIKILN